ncbi:F-box domain containing protein [Trema orientale]|uniref:F-box domain containing protein n=1 Tax=Trema orientale TaxID=63057 RepID=A0A2P5DQV4_TREOI|nr:F-box domain containing protein [Trema orientale]
MEAMDKISDLPTFILHRILSFLPREDAARTSVLSKRWDCVWDSFPIFKFDQNRFIKPKRGSSTPEHVEQVGRWIELVLDNGVRELKLKVSIAWKPYALPGETFHGKSVNGAYSKFYSLQTLKLEKVYITENTIRDIIHNCGNITWFALGSCRGLKGLDISNLDKLERVDVSFENVCELERVNIDAPNLKSFRLESLKPYLPTKLNLTSCHDLKKLTLIRCGITDDILHLHLSRFPLLEFLEICDCHMLRRIRISAQRLRCLHFGGRDKIEMIEIDAPTLSSFRYTAYNISAPLLFLRNVPCLMGIVYMFDQYNVLNSSWFLNLREFLGVPTQRKFFWLNFEANEVSFDLEELGELAIPPVIEVENLKLTYNVMRESIDFASLIDGLLWSCHPKTIYITSDSTFRRKCMKVLGEKLLDRERTTCCDSCHVKCWRHDLKGAKIEIFQRTKREDEPRLVYWDHLSDHALQLLREYDEVRFELAWK